jgi:hypothetical protein
MRTRTLLLLSVGVGLAILLAGGVLLVQLANESAAVEPAAVGELVRVGDVEATVLGTSTTDDGLLAVEVEVGGVDDDIASFRLLTGDRRLDPISAPADGRCTEITVDVATCRIEFDTSAAEGSSRVLILRRGDDQRNWSLTPP